MFRKEKCFLAACLCLTLVGRALAFTGGGPIGNGTDNYQDAIKAYGLPGDIMAPKNIGEEYRWTVPILSYAFDQTFLDYFGSNGVYAIEQAIAILNGVTNLSSYSADLSEVSLSTAQFNYTASALGIIDMKTLTLNVLLEELGLAEAERWVWCLRDRRPQPGSQCPDMIYDVIQRNFDPVTFEPSSYVNGTLYTYEIDAGSVGTAPACTGGNPLADATEILVDPDGVVNYTVSGGAVAFSFGGLHTGLTRDDIGGLRYLLRPSNLKNEPAPPNSRMIGGGFTNLDAGQILFTSNLATLVAQSQTNTAAQLQGLYPGLVVTHTDSFFATEVTTNLTAYFTNLPTAPVGTAASLVVRIDTTTNFVFRYRHTFGNVITNTYYTNMWIQKQNISVTISPTAPVGTTSLITNVSPSKPKPFLTNLVSGDFYILPANLCGYSIAGSLTYVTPITNVVLQVDATNVAGGGAGTNAGATNVTGVGQQSFTSIEITWFTNHSLAVYPIDCGNTAAALRAGIDRIQFQRVNYDSLIGRPLTPITNRFTLTVVTNGNAFPQTWERVTAQPDFLFTAGDLLDGTIARPTPNFTADPAPPGGALAGPGTISAPVTITYSKVGVIHQNLGPFTVHQYNTVTNFIWGIYDASTNPPIIFPNGLTISNLQYSVLHPNP